MRRAGGSVVLDRKRTARDVTARGWLLLAGGGDVSPSIMRTTHPLFSAAEDVATSTNRADSPCPRSRLETFAIVVYSVLTGSRGTLTGHPSECPRPSSTDWPRRRTNRSTRADIRLARLASRSGPRTPERCGRLSGQQPYHQLSRPSARTGRPRPRLTVLSRQSSPVADLLGACTRITSTAANSGRCSKVCSGRTSELRRAKGKPGVSNPE